MRNSNRLFDHWLGCTGSGKGSVDCFSAGLRTIIIRIPFAVSLFDLNKMFTQGSLESIVLFWRFHTEKVVGLRSSQFKLSLQVVCGIVLLIHYDVTLVI